MTDHQGTVRDWVESADFDSNNVVETQVTNHLNFDAFGNLQSVTDNTGQPTTLDSRLTILPAYTGQLYDADAGLHYYKARWYDSVIGKFISEDPMGFEAGDVNLGRIAANLVTQLADATGLSSYPFMPGGNSGKNCLGHLDGCGGVYIFPDLTHPKRAPYIGQSEDMLRRLREHIADGRFDPDGPLDFIEVPGGKDAREVVEQVEIQRRSGGIDPRDSDDVANKKNPVGSRRRKENGLPDPERKPSLPGKRKVLHTLGTIGDVIQVLVIPYRVITERKPPWQIFVEDSEQEWEELKQKPGWLITPGYIGPNPANDGFYDQVPGDYVPGIQA